MARLNTTIDPTTIPPSRGFELLPDGEYVAHIIQNDVTATKGGTGEILTLTWEILEGEYERRRVWQRINYLNNSEKAQAIGQGQVSAICDAIGYKEHFDDGDVLMFQPAIIVVGKGKTSPQYPDPQNEIKHVKALTAQPPASKPQTTAAPKPAVANGAKPPMGKPTAGPAGAGNRPWNRPAA